MTIALNETAASSGVAIASYQRTPSSPTSGKETCRVPTNLHGVDRSARPASRWDQGCTAWWARHNKDTAFVTNVLVLGKHATTFSPPTQFLKKGRQRKRRYRTSFKLDNSAQKLNYVTAWPYSYIYINMHIYIYIYICTCVYLYGRIMLKIYSGAPR